MSPFGTKKNFGISDSLLDAVRGVVKGEELEEKKLDPVGQEDDDVDNDGDVDSSDEYLKKRRKAIGKAMKGKKDDVDTDPKLDEELDEAVNPATVNLVMKYGKDDEKARFRRYANMQGLRPDEKMDRDKIIAVARGRAKSAKMEGLEDKTDNPANSQHLCAKQVVHESWGEGTPIHGEHAEPDADGHIAWYDVMFDHGIEQQVSIDEMKVTKSEAHMNHKKKK